MPAASRLPLPRLVMYGIAMNMAAVDQKDMSLMTAMLLFFLYLRPGEAVEARGKNIAPAVKGAGRRFQHVTVINRDQDEGKPDKEAFIFIKGVFIFIKGSLKNFVSSKCLVRDHALSTIIV